MSLRIEHTELPFDKVPKTHENPKLKSGLDLPDELCLEILDIISKQSVHDLLKLRQLCRQFKRIIDTSCASQIQIKHHYLVKTQHLSIPLDDIKYVLKENKLAVEIKNDLSVFHLSEELACVVPLISHLTVRDCKASHLERLLQLLKDSKRLTTLFLINCELDAKCVSHLQTMQTPEEGPCFYFCNMTINGGTPIPEEFAISSKKIRVIDFAAAKDYSIERFQEKETDLKYLNDFETATSDASESSESVIKAFDALRKLMQLRVVSSIWHSAIMDPYEKPISAKEIYRKVREYITVHPHHPAVISAASSAVEKFISSS